MQAALSERTRTPLVATALTVVTSGVCALLVDLEVLADLVSVGILSCFLLVAAACIWRRYAGNGADHAAGWGLVTHLSTIVAASLAISVVFAAEGPSWCIWALVGALCGAAARSSPAVCPCHVETVAGHMSQVTRRHVFKLLLHWRP